MDKKTFKILIVRGGSGGISLAARLVRVGFRRQIELLDRSKFHYSQPRWTQVGAGKVYKSTSERSEASMILFRVEGIKDCVRKFRPNSDQLQTAESDVIEFEDVIVATGIEFNEEEGKKCLLNFDKHSLQQKEHPNFFSIREVTGIPNSKTGATIRKQAPVVARNGVRFLKNEKMDPAFDGYSSCPVVTRIFKGMLDKFGYKGKLLPSFPLDPTKEKRNYWVPNKDLLPPIYWHGILKGCI